MSRSIGWTSKNPIVYNERARDECFRAMSRIDRVPINKWHFHRKIVNNYDFGFKESISNRAFFKLWEMVSSSALLDDNVRYTCHLAEAPGSFVQVVKKLISGARTVAVSKPPCSYAEVVKNGKSVLKFDESILDLPDTVWLYRDLTVDVSGTVDTILRYAPDGFPFVTADGGFDESEQYDLKEQLHYRLILCEIVCTLLLQTLKGTCIVKFFDTFTHTTMTLMWLLCSHYESFEIVKPLTSRPTNSERYVICRNFRGLLYDKTSLLGLTTLENIDDTVHLDIDVPDEFVSVVTETSERLSSQQTECIVSVLEHIRRERGFVERNRYSDVKSETFRDWSEKFDYQHGL